MQALSYYQRNKDRIKATYRVTRLTTKDGQVITGCRKRPWTDCCELCGRRINPSGKPARLGYHHWDKSQPSLGVWLCHACHIFAEFLDFCNANQMIRAYYALKVIIHNDFSPTL